MSDERGIQTDPVFEQEKQRILDNFAERAAEIEQLPFAVRGLARVGHALLRTVAVPVLALIATVRVDVRDSIDQLKDQKGVKFEVKRRDDWWKDILRRFGYRDDTIAAIEAMIPEDMPGPNILYTAYVIFFIFNQVGTLSRVVSGDTYKELMARFRPSTPSAGEVLRASFVRPELHDTVIKILRENGYTDDDIKVLFSANYALENEQAIREIYHRMGKDEGWLETRLAEHGFTPERIDEIKETLPVIPSIQDLVFFMGREAFEPDMIARYGLDELYPGELTQWAAKHGLSEFWARKYWLSHWNHPELRTVFELFHRDQINPEQMWNYFGLVEIPPFWREKLMNISYRVITRVDARRMWKVGSITDEKQLFDLYRHMGYSPDDAQLMTEWTKTYTAEQERDLTRTDIVQAYIDRDVSQADALMLLKRIGYPETYAEFILFRTDMERERSEREDKLKLIKDRFTANLITATEARNTLVGIGFRVERVNELLSKWEFLRWKATKLPSKTDLDKLFRANVITEAQYTDTMKRLGYTDQHIGWYLSFIQAGQEA